MPLSGSGSMACYGRRLLRLFAVGDLLASIGTGRNGDLTDQTDTQHRAAGGQVSIH